MDFNTTLSVLSSKLVLPADLARLEELRQRLRALIREMRYAGEVRENILSEIENIYKEEDNDQG